MRPQRGGEPSRAGFDVDEVARGTWCQRHHEAQLIGGNHAAQRTLG